MDKWVLAVWEVMSECLTFPATTGSVSWFVDFWCPSYTTLQFSVHYSSVFTLHSQSPYHPSLMPFSLMISATIILGTLVPIGSTQTALCSLKWGKSVSKQESDLWQLIDEVWLVVTGCSSLFSPSPGLFGAFSLLLHHIHSLSIWPSFSCKSSFLLTV